MRYSALGKSDLDASVLRVVPEFMVVDYTYEDLDSNNQLNIAIPANTMVLNVCHITTTAFSGGSPALTIGNDWDADGYLTAADTAVTGVTSGSSLAMSILKAHPLAAGCYHATAGVVRLTHAASLAAGEGKVYIMLISMDGTWRVPSL